MIKLENSKINRLKFARAFSNIPKVDISIECVIENQMGDMFADNEEDPQVFMTKNGPFTYIASTTNKEVVADFVKDIPAPCLIMPSSKCVTDEIKKQYKDSVVFILDTHVCQAILSRTILKTCLTNPHIKKISYLSPTELLSTH